MFFFWKDKISLLLDHQNMIMRYFAFLFFFSMVLAWQSAQAQEEDPGPDTVKVGVYVISIHDINFHDKDYVVRFWLWLLYDNPDFDFTSQLDIPNAKSVERPDVIIDSVDGKAWVMMKMKCEMKQNWNVIDFPFDRQHLNIQIENTLFDKSSLIFVPDQLGSTYDKELTLDGWKIENFVVKTQENNYETAFGYPDAEEQSSTYHAFMIEMDIVRDAWGLFLKIFIGMYISFLISIISFTPHPAELEPRFGLPVGGLFAAVGNKYIIDSLLPESSRFTLVDSLHTVTFLTIFATLLVSAIVLKLHDRGKTKLANKVNRICALVVVIGFVLLNLLLIFLAI